MTPSKTKHGEIKGCEWWANAYISQLFLENGDDLIRDSEQYTTDHRGGEAVGQSIRLASGKLGVRIPAATDPSREKRQCQLPCKTLNNWCECHWSLELTIINGCPVSQQVWHTKELSLLNGHGQNLQPVTGIGDVSIYMKNSRVGRKTLNKQKQNTTNQVTCQSVDCD